MLTRSVMVLILEVLKFRRHKKEKSNFLQMMYLLVFKYLDLQRRQKLGKILSFMLTQLLKVALLMIMFFPIENIIMLLGQLTAMGTYQTQQQSMKSN